jgi:hypothetical protein
MARRVVLIVLVVLVAFVSVGRASAAQPLPTPTQDPATTNAKADEILARAEFRKAQPNVLQRAGAAITRAVGDLLQSLLAGGIGAVAAWVILVAAGLGVTALAFRLTRDVRLDPFRGLVESPAAERRSPVEWRRLAEGHEARGEWKEALRCRYRALVADLVARRAIRDLPGRTTGEYRAEVGASIPGGATAFSGASELFERAWYGNRPTGPAENEQFRDLADQVLASGHERVDA